MINDAMEVDSSESLTLEAISEIFPSPHLDLSARQLVWSLHGNVSAIF